MVLTDTVEVDHNIVVSLTFEVYQSCIAPFSTTKRRKTHQNKGKSGEKKVKNKTRMKKLYHNPSQLKSVGTRKQRWESGLSHSNIFDTTG